MFKWNVGQIKVDAFHEQVVGDQYLFFAWILQHGAVVAHAADCGVVFGMDVFGQMFDEAEFAQCGYFGSVRFLHFGFF